MRTFNSVAEKVIEAGDKKCIRKDYGYSYRQAPFHKLGLRLGVLTSQGGGFITYAFGDGSSMRVSKAGTEEL